MDVECVVVVEDDWVGDVILFDDSCCSFLSISRRSAKDEDNGTSELVVVDGSGDCCVEG